MKSRFDWYNKSHLDCIRSNCAKVQTPRSICACVDLRVGDVSPLDGRILAFANAKIYIRH